MPTTLSASAFALVAALLAQTAANDDPPNPTPTPTPTQVVRLVVRTDDGAELRYPPLPWSPGMTVHDAMRLAQNLQGPLRLRFEASGRGETLFVKSILELPNEGASGRNWIYRLNGNLAKRGAGVQTLQPGDEILWLHSRAGLRETETQTQPEPRPQQPKPRP